MHITLEIPDDVARHLAASGADLSRRAIEALAIEEYKSGRLTGAAMRQWLGFATHDQLEGFPKAQRARFPRRH